MNADAFPTEGRLVDLLVVRATEGLNDVQSQELADLLERSAVSPTETMDLAAAAVHVAMIADQVLPMPERLRTRVLENYQDWSQQHGPDNPSRLRLVGDEHSPPRAPDKSDSSVARGMPWLSWCVAAACLVFAVFAWMPHADRAPTLAQQREELLRTSGDAVTLPWTPLEKADYGSVKGDVVWSASKQAGFLRLVGMPSNEPTKQQYQLWIVDPARDKHPIDGGVFDVAQGRGEVIVPIDAKLTANQAQVFAITLEQPGGVVVSDGPLLIVAKAESAEG